MQHFKKLLKMHNMHEISQNQVSVMYKVNQIKEIIGVALFSQIIYLLPSSFPHLYIVSKIDD